MPVDVDASDPGPGVGLSVLVSVSSGGSVGGEPSLAELTLRTLSSEFQSRVPTSYELVVVDDSVPGAFPDAIRASRGALLGFVPAGAIVTPRLVEHAIAGARLSPRPLLLAPSYDLDISAEAFVRRLETQSDGSGAPYDLFEASRFAPVNEKGFLCSLRESTSFFCTRDMCGENPSASSAGALYGALIEERETRLVVLGGEGAFFDGAAARPNSDAPPVGRAEREPLLFGVFSGQAQEPLRLSVGRAAMLERVKRKRGFDPFTHDRAVPLPSAETARAPRLSIVVVAYAIPRQVENTVHSLSAAHQCNVLADDYEILVVENRSHAMLGEARARAASPSVRYFERDERGVSPVPALNLGIAEARGDAVGLMIDGARMVTPRLVEHALAAFRVYERPIVIVPGYDLGPGQQHLTGKNGYGEDAEQRLLEGIDWKRDGYRLFEVACFDEATQNGFLNPLLECTCLFTTRGCLEEVGGVDERFDLPGGGIANLDLFERLCRLPRTRTVVLWGEGSFHQFHGSVSRGLGTDREARLATFREQYVKIRGREYQSYEREPVLLGTNPAPGASLVAESAGLGRVRYGIRRGQGRPEWENG